MADIPAAIRIAQTVGITSAAFVAGGTLCISYHYVPSLTLAPYPLIVRQWKKSFDTGKIIHPGIALVSAFAYGYLAYQMQGTLNQHKAEIYGVCVASNLLIWPWTIFIMMPTNKKLFRKFDHAKAIGNGDTAAEPESQKGESAKELIQWWSTLNIARGCMPLVGAVLGLWVTIS